MPVSKKNLIFSFLVLLSTFTNDLDVLRGRNSGGEEGRGGGGTGTGGVECSIQYKRKKIVYQGDIMIGALLPVHEQPSHVTTDTPQSNSVAAASQSSSIVAQSARRICGIIRDQYGVQRVEALLYTLDKINNKNLSRLLPGIRLGLEIRDECWDSSIALEETIDFIKDTIAIDNDEPTNSSGDNQNQNNGSTVIINQNGAFSSSTTAKDMDLHEKCQAISKEKKEKKKIFAVIGPGASSVSINVQNLLQLFDIPQIGYSATSRDLSDKKMYKTFLRVVPSDYLQVRAMLDLVIAMNWTYIFAIYTEGSYGQTGMEAFRNETSYLDICLAMYEKIREYAVDEDYDKIIRKMNTTSSARVIVCFCYGETIRGLLGAINRFGLKGRFLIVGSDGWSDRIDVAKDYYQEAVGSFSIKAYSPKVTEFDDYFINLNPTNNQRNIWFNEYWEERFDCYIEEATKAKFKTSCKKPLVDPRKCPADFVEIGNNCYYFSTQDANWVEARAECRSKYDNSDLLDLNSAEDLNDVLEYAASQAMTDHLLRMHVRVKISSPVPSTTSTNTGDEIISTSGVKTTSNEEQTLKLVHCPTKYRAKSQFDRPQQASAQNEDIYDDEIDMEEVEFDSNINESNDVRSYRQPAMANESSVSDFLSSLSDSDVITFFNLRLKPDVQCIAIHISNKITPAANNFSFCAQFKVCYSRLPYVCKLSPPSPTAGNRSASAAPHRKEFYPDTLRNYQQDPKMSYVINSLLAIAHGLDRVHQKFCNGNPGLCEKMKNLNGSELLNSIKASSFSGITGENIYFDPNGDPPGRYVILNVQREENADNLTKYIYREVGNWNNDKRLALNLDQIKFPNNYKNYRSVCSEGCDFGYVKQIQGGVKCCWNCKKCEEHAFIANEYTCKDCEYGYWPNKNLTGCDKLPLTYLKWNEPAALVALFVSCVGMLVNTFITYIFLTFSNTCIVKSTTKELSYIILTGIYFCYLMTWPLIMKPTEITCYLYRILPGFSLSLIYGALITKTNRIARILARSKKRIITKKPRFMSLTAQIIITLIIITIEATLIVVAFVFEPGNVIVDDRTRRYEARLMCANKTWSVIGPIGYNMCLVVLCTFYAVRTRNLPENFNEAKFIGFSMYTTCVIWLAFIPLFFGSDFKVITLCLSTSFSATVILIFLFIPKVYIILFEPEKNQRSAFATAKEIRCHFGSNVQSSSIDDRSKMGNGFALLDKLGLKPVEMKSSLKRSGSQRSKSANTRFAYRPRSIHGDPRLANMNDKSMDSFDTYTSIYQISDRSCQTSLELLEPFVDRAIKRRKLVAQEAAMAMSFSEGELNKLSDDAEDIERMERNRKSSKMAEMLELEKDASGPPTGLGALGNLLLFPLIATHHPQMGPNAANSSSVQTHDNNEDEDLNKKSNKHNNTEQETESGTTSAMTTADEASAVEFMRSKRFGKRMSQGAFELMEPFSKVFNKAKNLRMSMRLGRRMSQAEQEASTGTDLNVFKTSASYSAKTSDAATTTDSSSSSANESLANTLRTPIKSRTPLRLTKTKNVLNQIAENSASVESNENNSPSGGASIRKPSSESIRSDNGIVVVRSAEKCLPVNEEEGATTDSVSSLNKIAVAASSSNQQSAPNRRIVLPPMQQPASDCDSEFTIKMELEDKSLEDFNRVINQNKNLVLNWDYVQSSDYL